MLDRLRGKAAPKKVKVYARGEDDEYETTEHPVASEGKTEPHALARQRTFRDKLKSNFVSEAYARARRKGGYYWLSSKNRRRCVNARVLKAIKPRWARGSARLFRYMHLHPCEVDVLYALFRLADADRSGTLAVGELMTFLGLEHSDFANRIFCMMEYIRGVRVTGSCDFESYVVSVWNVCTLEAGEYRDFCFEIYDADESGYLDRAEVLDLVADITTETFAGSERTALLLQDLSHHELATLSCTQLNIPTGP